MKERIYVCHTFYHVYITFLKEMNLPAEQRGKATLVISHMSNQFGTFPERVRSLHFFAEVIDFDEKGEDFFPELAKYRKSDRGMLRNLWNRIRFTRKLAELETPYVPVDFRQYKEIYVFCDSDAIGFYLNQNKIYYHAVEDGLNCLRNGDLAHYDNRKHFALKAFLSQKCNLIFIQNGFGKYCIDMEVNDRSVIEIPFEKYVEVPRKALLEGISTRDRDLLLQAFVEDIEELKSLIFNEDKKTALILTEPLCTLPVRKRIFTDIINRYQESYSILLKPHPRDELDYRKEFPGICVIEKTVPMEMLNFFESCRIDLVVSVFTELGALECAKEKVRLGADFMDQYEAPSMHRQADILRKEFPVRKSCQEAEASDSAGAVWAER